ncbi:MAG: hypothetical protein JWO57_4446, partial [Pseudonocardiales bacterium]|nr:hypothetical protein [Pseudonocardiales bacterium]
MSRISRFLPLLCALLGLAALLVPLTAARAAAPATQSVATGADFASAAWQDPWDFTNPSDLLLDNGGPASGLIRPSRTGGVVSFSIAGPAYVSPLWAGYPGSLRLGRDGGAAANMINAGAYTRMHLHAYASRPVSVLFEWFTCGAPAPSCLGAMTTGMGAGWN